MNPIICSNCGTRMITSTRYECEAIGVAVCVTRVTLNDCPECACKIVVSLPIRAEQQLNAP